MSTLSELLYTERHRPRMSEEGGPKIPAILSHQVHEDLDLVAVSRYRDGETVLFVEDFDDEVRSAFFELDPEDEDAWMAHLIDQLYIRGAQDDWPAVAAPTDWDGGVIEDVESCFDHYELPLKKVFVGRRGLNHLLKHELVDRPERFPSTLFDSNGEVEDWRESPILGLVHQCPLLWNPEMGDKIAWATSSEMVGSLDRLEDFVSVCVHNPIRGLAILSIDHAET